MASPSSESIPTTAPPDRSREAIAGVPPTSCLGLEPVREVVYIADLGTSIASDYEAFLCRGMRSGIVRLAESFTSEGRLDRAALASLIVFLPSRLDETRRRRLVDLFRDVARRPL